MKKDIILAGVGGQGILSIATMIGVAVVDKGLYVKQAEVHGMSQRGGDVQSHLRISDQPIYSDLIPMGKADMIISIEPMESLRYLPYLHPQTGWLITNSTPFINISNYPDEEEVKKEIAKIKNHVLINADAIAKDSGNSKAANMVILGAASLHLGIDFDALKKAIHASFGRKGEDVVNSNIAALEAGRQAAEEYETKHQ
ncbi:MAG: indolepyruvate oxidoreductase subunit beta [Bacteroidales bacterium]|jgi:indolepyruvate ferredoxin oxidoreductase beta subunit|nr:indolepyruvate oxidoreductase subunit beta [Bacteroidales bacterium]